MRAIDETNKRKNNSSVDGGVEFVGDTQTPFLSDRILLTSKLIVYQALVNSETDKLKGLPNEDYWRYPDVNWEMIFSTGITKLMSINLYMQLLYDKEINKAGRFKQTLALGISYKFI